MTEHLSSWSLDQLADGRALAPSKQRHLAGCAECRQRFAEHAEALDAARADPRLRQIRAQVLAAAPTRSPWRWPARAVAAVAAALVGFFVLRAPTPEPTVRTKGAASLALVGRADGVARAVWPIGAEVALRVDGAPPYLLILAVDGAGEASVAWPASAQSGPRPADGVLSPGFRVTPGDLTLVALFTAQPLDADAARATLAAAAAACVDPLDRGCLGAGAPAADARAWYRLRVDADGDAP